jgi:hypothetical protein
LAAVASRNPRRLPEQQCELIERTESWSSICGVLASGTLHLVAGMDGGRRSTCRRRSASPEAPVRDTLIAVPESGPSPGAMQIPYSIARTARNAAAFTGTGLFSCEGSSPGEWSHLCSRNDVARPDVLGIEPLGDGAGLAAGVVFLKNAPPRRTPRAR